MTKQAPFNPTQIGSCTLWLDGQDPNGTGTPPAQGSTITTWADKSGGGNTATAYGTITYSALVNGYLAMSTTSSSGFYGYITNSGSTATTFTVATLTNSSPGYSRLFAASTGTNTDFSTPTSVLFSCTISNGTQIGAYYNSPSVIPLCPGTLTVNQPFIITTAFTGTQCIINLTGAPTSASPTTQSSSFGYTYYGIGTHADAYGSVGECWAGTIAEVIHYTAALSPQQYQKVEAYLAQKWGLQGSLPQGHPGTTAIVYSQKPFFGHVPFTSGPPTGISVYGISALTPITTNYIGFTITGSTAASATNYQIPVTVYRSTGTNTGSSVYLGTAIYSDYSNLLFRASDQVTALPFYIESGTQTASSAKIWVSVPSIPASPSTTKVYIYWYPSGTYTSPSSGTSTFTSLFDDFNGTAGSAPNASIWSVQLKGVSTSSTVQLSGSGTVVLTPTSNSISSASLLSVNTMPANGFAIHIRRQYNTGVYTDTSFATTNTLVDSDTTLMTSWWHTTIAGGYNLFYQGTSSDTVRRQPLYTGSSQAYTSIAATSISGSTNTYEIVEIQYSTAGLINILWNGTNKAAVTDTTFLSGGKYILIAQGNYSGYSNTETVDYVFVRSYLNPEPAVSAWGSINTP